MASVLLPFKGASLYPIYFATKDMNRGVIEMHSALENLSKDW